MKDAYYRLFRTKDGDAVLRDLRRQFYDQTFKSECLERQVGRRDVLLHIIRMSRETS